MERRGRLLDQAHRFRKERADCHVERASIGNDDLRLEISVTKFYHMGAYSKLASDTSYLDYFKGDFFNEDKQVIITFDTMGCFADVYDVWRGNFTDLPIELAYLSFPNHVFYDEQLYQYYKLKHPNSVVPRAVEEAWEESDECDLILDNSLGDPETFIELNLRNPVDAIMIQGDGERTVEYIPPFLRPDLKDEDDPDNPSLIELCLHKDEPELIKSALTYFSAYYPGEEKLEEFVEGISRFFRGRRPEFQR